MRDNRAREKVADQLERVSGVIQVDVNLYRAQAVIMHSPSCVPSDLVRAVVNAGYLAVLQAETR